MALKPFNSDDGYSVGLEGNINVIDATGNFTATGSIRRNNRNVPTFVFQANTPPANALVGDQWFDTNTGILFEYLNDGTSSQWVDTNGLPGAIVNTTNLTVSGTATFGNANTVHIYGGTTGQFLQTDGNGNLTWATGGSGNGAPISVLDEGNLLTNNLTVLNFAGAGVTATAVGSNVLITIPGGGGGSGDSISNGTSNLSIPSANGNIAATVDGVANVMVISNSGITVSNLTSGGNVAGAIYDGNQRIVDIGASMPYTVSNGQTINIPNNKQGLYTLPITVDGVLEVDGVLVQVDGTPTYGNQIINGNSNVVVTANSNVTISVAGNSNVVTVTNTGLTLAGNLVPTQDITFSLGNVTNRWNNLYLSGNTIILGDASISSANGNVLLPNTIYIGNVPVQANGNSITFAGAEFDGNLTAANAELGNVASANFFVGDGSLLTNVSGVVSNTISSGTSNIVVNANGNVVTSVAGNANIFTVTGLGANLNGYANIFGNLLALNANLGNAVSANYFIGDGGLLSNISGGGNGTAITNGNSNVVVEANGNIVTSVAGVANVLVFTSTGAIITGTANVSGNITSGNINAGNLMTANFVSGTLTTAAQPNITSVGTLSSLGVTGNISSGNLSVTSNTSTGNLSVTGNTTSGNVDAGNLLSANFVSGTLTTSYQPNITTVGTLTDLYVSGNALVTGNLTVDGNLTYINVETLSVQDPIIELQTGPNGTPPVSNTGKDVGTALNYYDTQARVGFMGWDVSNAEFVMASRSTITNEVVTINSLGNLRANYFIGDGSQLSNLNIPSGTSINNGNSNVVAYANGNVATSVSGNANVLVVTGNAIETTGIKTDNYMYANGQPFSGGGGGNAQPQVFNVYQAGNLIVYTGTARWYAAYNLNITSVKPRLVTAADANVVLQVVKNSNTVVLTQTIPPGNTTISAYTSNIALLESDYITVNVTQIGSNAAPGTDLYVQFQFLKT